VSLPRQASRDVRRVHELNVNKREKHLAEVNTVRMHGLDTNKRLIENNTRFFVSA